MDNDQDSRSRHTFDKSFLEQQHASSNLKWAVCVVFLKQRISQLLGQTLEILPSINRRNVKLYNIPFCVIWSNGSSFRALSEKFKIDSEINNFLCPGPSLHIVAKFWRNSTTSQITYKCVRCRNPWHSRVTQDWNRRSRSSGRKEVTTNMHKLNHAHSDHGMLAKFIELLRLERTSPHKCFFFFWNTSPITKHG